MSERDPIIVAQAEKYVAFMEAGKAQWLEDVGIAMQELYTILTNNGEKPFGELNRKNESMMVRFPRNAGINGETDIGRTEFMQYINTLPEESLIKVLAFPYDLEWYETHGHGDGGSASLQWTLQCYYGYNKTELTDSIYGKLVLHALGEEKPENSRINLLDVETIKRRLENPEEEGEEEDEVYLS